MMLLSCLLWICGWLAAISTRALYRQSVTFVDLFVTAFLSWFGMVLEMCHASGSYEIWKGGKPVARRHVMNPYRQMDGRKRRW